ncbi:dihydrofolate reductase family protein [Actinomadura rugatobispora]|uniref:Dihydrofolate reductase family protein n=1 Tax=Actinomadura rugatobispora TaxID=1994 RepID=A0ABW1AGS9_9ACTN|nr:dihydrofolate reductase family protein [Actinomadura rugatobispora]
MRKIFAFFVVTADGYYEGPNGEFDWPNVDQEFMDFSVEQLDEIGTLVFGRITYDMVAAHWPTPQAREDAPAVADRMNATPKIVVSRTLQRADWADTRLLADDVAGELTKLKQQPGKDIAIFGSSNLTVSLLDLGLVDELRIMVHPIVLSEGKSLFHTAEHRIPLELTGTRAFKSGNVMLYYRPLTN